MHRQKESGFSMKKKNPVDRYGRVTKCSICESIFHWVRDCPERGTEKEDQISLFSNEIQKTYLPQFLQRQSIVQFWIVDVSNQFVGKHGSIFIQIH